MVTYIFERTGGTLSEGKVREIIKRAGENLGQPERYDPADYTYTEPSTKEVRARGAETMAVNSLEKAATELGYKNTSVSIVELGASAPNLTLGGTLALDATDYGVTITMDQATVSALSDGGYSLYGFKAVQTTVGGGMPLVWFKTNTYGLSTDVSWQIQFEAYTSQSQIIPGGQITGLNSYSATLASN